MLTPTCVVGRRGPSPRTARCRSFSRRILTPPQAATGIVGGEHQAPVSAADGCPGHLTGWLRRHRCPGCRHPVRRRSRRASPTAISVSIVRVSAGPVFGGGGHDTEVREDRWTGGHRQSSIARMSRPQGNACRLEGVDDEATVTHARAIDCASRGRLAGFHAGTGKRDDRDASRVDLSGLPRSPAPCSQRARARRCARPGTGNCRTTPSTRHSKGLPLLRVSIESQMPSTPPMFSSWITSPACTASRG